MENVGENVTARKTLVFEDNIKQEWTPRTENILMDVRVSNLENQVDKLLRKLDRMATAINIM